MKIRGQRDLARLRDAAPLKRRHGGVLLCWSLALSLAQLPGGGKAFADGGAKSSQADTGANGERGSGDPQADNGPEDDSGDGQAIQKQSEGTDQENAREAVVQGRVLPLKTVLAQIDPERYGTVIAVDLRRYKGKDVYRLKTRDSMGVIRELRIDAQTGKFMNVFGL